MDQCQPQWRFLDLDEVGQAVLLCDCLQERKGWSPTNHCTKIVKFAIKYFFSKCDQILRKLQKTLVTFTEEILNGKLHFLRSELFLIWCI